MRRNRSIWGVIATFFLLTQFTFGYTNKPYFDNYNVNNGLSNNYVDCIFQDHEGWIWIGTRVGVERFDGIRFKEYDLYVDDTTKKEGLLIRDFYQASDNMLYVCYEEEGLAYYNRDLDRFESMKMVEPKLKMNHTAKDVIEDTQKNLWIATKEGVLKYNPIDHTIQSYTKGNNDPSISDNYVRKVTLDPSGKIWIGTKEGLDYLDPETGEIIHFANKYSGLHDDILDIWIGDENRKWIGTSTNGIVIIDSGNTKFNTFFPDENEPRSYKVSTICKKSENEIWIGTRGGIYVYDQQNQNTRHFVHNVLEDKSLVHNSVLNILKDDQGDIWIGTRGGMSHYSQEKQGFVHYKSIPENNNYMNNSEIFTIWKDSKENVWLGTEKGGINILDHQTGKFEYITTDTKYGLSSNCIKDILPLDETKVLIGTFQGGLNIYNRKTKKTIWFKHDPQNKSSISSDIVWDIARDHDDNIWLATASGLDLFDPKDMSFTHVEEIENSKPVAWLKVDSNNDLWLGYHDIKIYRPGEGIIQTIHLRGRGVHEDSKGRFWITTEDRGIALCDKESGVIREFSESSGIASKLTYCIEEDENGKLWISTANGLSCFNPENGSFNNYSTEDGLQSNQFYYGASYKDENGNLYFGGINGLTVLDPKNIAENHFMPPVYITDLKIFNESVKIKDDKYAILTKSISETGEIQIPYKHNVITFEFAALNYTNSKQNKYKYKLEGFDNDWIEPNENRSATYTNLNPGEYTFKVIASNNNGYWNDEGTSLNVVVAPPFYMTIWFKITLVLAISLIMILVFRFILKRRELQRALAFEKERAKNLHELDVFKLKFFTNISHEIKTPLTLIISPLKKLLQQKDLPVDASESVKLMERNAQHLLRLVTQLLDHRKLEEGKLQIELKRGDIVSFCSSIFNSFEDVMNEKKLSHSFISVQDEIITNFDPNKLKHILNNIISNAIKYNKTSGRIDFILHMVVETKKSSNEINQRFIKMVIEDTGIGIKQKDIDNIFTRYYSTPSSNEITSTGIGLAFAKELIELHEGRIFVESTEGRGSKFTIMLPLIEDMENDSNHEQSDIANPKEYIRSKEFEQEQQNKKVILVIDDNTDILSFIKLHFKNKYLVFVSETGKEGLDIAFEAIPDLIISDVMLPDYDGKELCKKLKEDERTSHIPIVLLSALTSEEHIMDGLEKGANDYIPKPFDIMMLQIKVENILSSRDAWREKYSRQISFIPTNHKVSSPDEQFLKKVLKYIEENLDIPDLDIDKFAQEMGVSRMQLYRKITALTNMSVKECIIDIRLKRAAQILSQNKTNISDVAYSVGFNDLSYFGKCFKNKFGKSPTEYMKWELQQKEDV